MSIEHEFWRVVNRECAGGDGRGEAYVGECFEEYIIYLERELRGLVTMDACVSLDWTSGCLRVTVEG